MLNKDLLRAIVERFISFYKSNKDVFNYIDTKDYNSPFVMNALNKEDVDGILNEILSKEPDDIESAFDYLKWCVRPKFLEGINWKYLIDTFNNSEIDKSGFVCIKEIVDDSDNKDTDDSQLKLDKHILTTLPTDYVKIERDIDSYLGYDIMDSYLDVLGFIDNNHDYLADYWYFRYIQDIIASYVESVYKYDIKGFKKRLRYNEDRFKLEEFLYIQFLLSDFFYKEY